MRNFALLVLVVVFGWSSGASAAPVQWTTASGGNGHWYDVVSDNPLSWQDAQTYAVSQGGYLATLTSSLENDFAISLADNALSGFPVVAHAWLHVWIGGYQNTASPTYSEPSGGWEWVTGEAWSFTDWGSGQPNNSSAHGNGDENYLILVSFGNGSLPPHGWEDHGSPVNNWQHTVTDGQGFFILEYDTNPIPEPTTALLLTLGLAGLGMRRRG